MKSCFVLAEDQNLWPPCCCCWVFTFFRDKLSLEVGQKIEREISYWPLTIETWKKTLKFEGIIFMQSPVFRQWLSFRFFDFFVLVQTVWLFHSLAIKDFSCARWGGRTVGGTVEEAMLAMKYAKWRESQNKQKPPLPHRLLDQQLSVNP